MVKSVDSGTNLPGFMPASSLTSFVTLDKSLDPSCLSSLLRIMMIVRVLSHKVLEKIKRLKKIKKC